MHLSKNDVKRFYNIWFPLLHFVNQREKVTTSFPSTWGDDSVSPKVAAPIRDVLWERDDLREAFIHENPAKLNSSDLALVRSWDHRVSDNFFIFRYLKKYTIFIDSKSPATGYGVLGIAGTFEEMMGPYLPIYVNAVLIPFGDQIIYDSLLAASQLYFGSGFQHNLEETYRDIQERGRLFTSLQPGSVDELEIAQTSNKKVLKAFQKALGQSGLSPKKMQEHMDTMTQFSEDSLQKQAPPVLLLDITPQHIKTYRESVTGKLNLVSFKRFVWFLRDTGRIYWEDAEDMLDFIKSVR